jgi:hypothetical protein
MLCTGALLLTIAFVCTAQDVPRISLKVRDRVLVGAQAPGHIVLPVRCDRDGNLYMRLNTTAGIARSPVAKISPDGKIAATFSLDASRGTLRDFAAGRNGSVYLLSSRSDAGTWIAEISQFDDAGQLDSVRMLKREFWPSNLAVYSSGSFLVAGVSKPEKGLKEKLPFTGIFSSNGDVIATVTTKEENMHSATKEGNQAIFYAARDAGDVLPGEYDDMYLIRATSPANVMVISADGEVQRQFGLEPPEKDLEAFAVKVAGGKIAAEFSDAKGYSKFISVYDAQTGERTADYELGEGAEGVYACYAQDHFTFLSAAANNQLEIRQAYAH